MTPTTYAKAILGALIAGLGALATALTDEKVTSGEWVAVAIAALTALGVVYAVPNQAVQRNERGATDLTTVAVVLVIIIAVVVLVRLL